MRVTISRRDTADTAITVESLLDPSLHLQSFFPTPGTVSLGIVVDNVDDTENKHHAWRIYSTQNIS